MNKRDFLIKASLKKKIKSKWFLIINIIMFLLLILVFNTNTIISKFGGDYNKTRNIFVYDNANIYKEFKKKFINNNTDKNYNYKLILKNNDLNETKKTLVKDKNNIIIVINNGYDSPLSVETYTYNGMGEYSKDLIENTLNDINEEMYLERYGITKEEFNKISEKIKIKNNILYRKSNGDSKVYLSTFILMCIIMPGYFLITNLVQMIGSEINEEKTTKSMEIIISNVKPKDHLIAKVISCTIFTIFQGLLIILYALVAITIRFGSTSDLTSYYSDISNFTGTDINTNLVVGEVMNGVVTSNLISTLKIILPIIIIFFIFTLISYAIVSASLASMSTNIDNFQQLQIPITILMALGLYLAFSAALFDGSTFIKIMSYVPMLSFLIAPSLFLLEQISLIELLISLLIQIIFTFIIYHYGLRIYKVGLLNYQNSHLLKRIFKALKNKE